MTTILYDENGKLWLTVDGHKETPVVNVLTCDVPSDKKVVGIDTSVEPHQPILVDKTDSPEYMLQQLTRKVNEIAVSVSNTDTNVSEVYDALCDLDDRVFTLEEGN